MATDEQLPLEVRGHSAKAIAAGETEPIRGHSAKAIAEATGETGPTGTSERPDIPHGLNGGTGPSVTNASTFVPNQMWEPPPRRRTASLDGAFASGAFDPGAFQLAEELRARAARTIAGGADTIEISPPVAGTAALTNFNAVVVQSAAIRCLLVDAIDRAKANGWNSGVAELEVILSLTDNLHHLLLEASPVDEKVGTSALSFRDALVNLWNQQHERILSSSFYSGLFISGLYLCSSFNLVSQVALAALICGPKELKEVLKEAAKLIGGESKE